MGTGDVDVRLTFDRVPYLYDRIRPTYPAELFDQLFVVLPETPSIVEVGPGTGQATGDLLNRGARVTAVEYGENLANYLAKKFGGEPGLTVINTSFEDADVAERSFDAVVSATAYHWVSQLAQIQRPLDVLRPGGVLGVIDLIQVDSEIDRDYFSRVQRIYESFDQARVDELKTYETAVPAIAPRLQRSGRYSSVEVFRVPWDQTYTSQEYRDLLLTYSGTQLMPEPDRSQMVNELVAVVDAEFSGVVTRPLVATLTLATA